MEGLIFVAGYALGSIFTLLLWGKNGGPESVVNVSVHSSGDPNVVAQQVEACINAEISRMKQRASVPHA